MKLKLTRIGCTACATLMLMSMAACGGGGSDAATPPAELTLAQRIQQLEASGALPKLDRSADVTGPDADKNGIRDDIDAYITATYPEPAKKQAASQYARMVQAALLVNTADSSAVNALSIRDARATHCLVLQFGADKTPQFSEVSDLLLAYTTNTKSRLQAYLAYDKSLAGTVLSRSEGDTCE